jgi:dynactin-4
MPEYKSRVDIVSAGVSGGGGDLEVDYMRRLRDVQTVGSLEQRWGNSWAGSLQVKSVIYNVAHDDLLTLMEGI